MPISDVPISEVPISEVPCFEDDTAYFGNNARTGGENPQKSRLDCQQSCEFHPSCHYWTFRKPDLQSNGDSPAQWGQNLSEVAFLFSRIFFIVLQIQENERLL